MASGIKDKVVILAVRDDIELVLKAGTAAALDRDAQHGAVRLLRQDCGDTLGGAGGNGDRCGFSNAHGAHSTVSIKIGA